MSGVLRAMRVEAVDGQWYARAARHGDHVHDGIGRAAQRQHRRHRVVDAGRVEEVARLQVLPHHVDDAAPGLRRHAPVTRIGGGNRRRARQRETHRFRGRGHRRRGAHRHAMAGRPRDAVLDLAPLRVGDVAGALLGPELPDVRAAAQLLVAPVPGKHRPGRHEDRRQVHADRAHQHRRRGLVAAAHQHRAIDRIRAQQLLGLHRQQVAVEHRRRLLENFGERDGRHFQRKPARLQHATLHFLRALPEMRMARVDVAPRVDDRDDRLALVIGARIAHLRRARMVAERAHVVVAEPAVRAQVGGLLARAHGGAMRVIVERRAEVDITYVLPILFL